MANTHQHIDLTTLKEVERLLTTAEVATMDANGSGNARALETIDPSGGLTPLPKRR